MEYVSAFIFAFGLVGVIALLGLKAYEDKHCVCLYAEKRVQADAYALVLKSHAFHVREDLARVPPIVLALLRLGVHEGALLIARTARTTEKYAHKLADVASHKHHFERHETRSDFLRRMSEPRGISK